MEQGNKAISIHDFHYFHFDRVKEKILLTNDLGDFLFIEPSELKTIIQTPEKIDNQLYANLMQNRFLRSAIKDDEYVKKLRDKYWFLNYGPSLFAFVTSLRCDHACTYCQVSRVNLDEDPKVYDMTSEIVEQGVDMVLQSTAQNICIEFQGGEPLVNFPAIVHTVETVKKRNTSNKNIIFSVVTNTTYLDDEKVKFLLDNEVSICVSLDGPEEIHDKYRKSKGDGYANVIKWIKKITAENQKRSKDNIRYNKVNAIPTFTHEALKNYKAVIDTYLELGLPSIQIRPMQPLGFGKGKKTFNSYSAEEYIEYFRKAMDYILEINRGGTPFFEKISQAYLRKIIDKRDSNYLDIRNPGGFGIGGMAFNYDGGIYTCDEGRMVHAMGDDSFKLGQLGKSSYLDIMNSATVKEMAIASTLEGLPGCHECVYNPYCSVSPIYNYVLQGGLFGQMPTNYRHKITYGHLQYLFETMEENSAIYHNWLKLN